MSTAVVTGAASGMGPALAAALARAGYEVHVADTVLRDELVHETGVVSSLVDPARSEDMERFAQSVGDVDFVVLNAGTVGSVVGPPWEVPPEEWNRLLGVKLLGVLNGLRAFVPKLLEHGRPAKLLIATSLAGLVTFPSGGADAATEHAVVTLAEQASLLLRETAVSVTLVCPALLGSGTSAEGDDPAAVAASALRAASGGQFLVMPEEWKYALLARGRRLSFGLAPEMPAPTTANPLW